MSATPNGHHQAQESHRRRPPRKMFARLIKNIEVAARVGGGDPAGNPTLYDAIQKAKKSSVPNENIERPASAVPARRPRRRLADHHLRGLRPQRGGHSHRMPHRQPQPRSQRGAGRDDPQRRHNGRPRSVSYLFSRKGLSRWRRTASPRTMCWQPCWTPARRTSTTSVTASRSSPNPAIWWPCAPPCSKPESTTTPRRPGSSRR
ncbi:hypothetical protein I553_3581 [Mycobacterium xenopi 4042]|uniref:TACO1/YebC-like N-terminal domain-containing protein n=1 Tax=Mycobacterium xenopi 4042 TaxID=1299334 RepID=X8DLS3_MYCXE|nr:hypothetical protein I553_3581 [Mycobacterium xenopi 4042]